MNERIKLTVILLGAGVILAFLPYNASKSFQLKADELLGESVKNDFYFTVDEVARFVNSEDSTVQIIDVRSPKEFLECSIPGSINIPFDDFLNPNWEGYLNQNDVRNIFYGNGEKLSAEAWTVATGLGYKNNFIMQGGLNEWFETVMLSQFEGDKITARENAIFENRFKARKTFTQINSLPDSLKMQYLAAKRLEKTKLDGGCE